MWFLVLLHQEDQTGRVRRLAADETGEFAVIWKEAERENIGAEPSVPCWFTFSFLPLLVPSSFRIALGFHTNPKLFQSSLLLALSRSRKLGNNNTTIPFCALYLEKQEEILSGKKKEKRKGEPR